MPHNYVIIDDFGSTAQKFDEQKEFLQKHVVGFTFSPKGWDEIKEHMAKSNRAIDINSVKFLGREVIIVELQKFKCLGWYNVNYMRLYIKISQIRYSTLKNVVNKYTTRN